MSFPTAAQLVERLRQVYSTPGDRPLSDEALAARLPISGSTLARWKKGDPDNMTDLLGMLDAAGWLSTDGDDQRTARTPHDPLEVLAARVAELGRGQALIAGALGVQLEEPAPIEAPETKPRARPKRKKA